MNFIYCRPKRNAFTNKYGGETKVSGHLDLNVDDFVIKKGHPITQAFTICVAK
ncbi:hypothetical protein V6B33_14660 [Mangrovibacillus sp. Mu-81]|jgi:hypothetical protein|uniref:hypothetical protein n=1 Tax=Mangrovibacillus sp. Mu-81 TaxID=3121478 RepID=UPI002FE47F86